MPVWRAFLTVGALMLVACSAGPPSIPPAPTSPPRVEERADGAVRFYPTSGSVEIGRRYRYEAYTHCSLDYSFDVDGSLWEVSERPEADGHRLEDPIDVGVVELVQEDIAVFTSSDGGQYVLRRLDQHYKEHPGLCE